MFAINILNLCKDADTLVVLKIECKMIPNFSGPLSQNGCGNGEQIQIATTAIILSLQSSFQ